jgi:putative hydrolase of HD superfamily
MAGVQDPESVGDHCFEASLIAYILARHVDVAIDLGRVLTMLLFHEVGEVRLTDMPRRAAPYIKAGKNAAEVGIAKDVLAGVADEIADILAEFHARETPEARLAEAAEELQIIFASLMYAKESVGDMSEYRQDVAAYKDYGVSMAGDIARVIEGRLGAYLGAKPYWELGYRRDATS